MGRNELDEDYVTALMQRVDIVEQNYE